MDLFLQKFYEARAFEAHRGSADLARAECRRAILDGIARGRPLDGLSRASAILDSVERREGDRRVRIGITGDYYTRICEYANADIFREIERLGGVVMLPPTLSEFVKYDAHAEPARAARRMRLGKAAAALALRQAVERGEREVRRIFGDSIGYGVPLEYGRAMELISGYMDPKMPAGLTGSVAAIMEQIEAGADGILNLITFHCSYGLVVGAALSCIGRDFPEIPRLTLIFEGLKPTHNLTRLEAFMERVRERAMTRRVLSIPCKAGRNGI